jgi:hypothetical protein
MVKSKRNRKKSNSSSKSIMDRVHHWNGVLIIVALVFGLVLVGGIVNYYNSDSNEALAGQGIRFQQNSLTPEHLRVTDGGTCTDSDAGFNKYKYGKVVMVGMGPNTSNLITSTSRDVCTNRPSNLQFDLIRDSVIITSDKNMMDRRFNIASGGYTYHFGLPTGSNVLESRCTAYAGSYKIKYDVQSCRYGCENGKCKRSAK